MFEFKIHSTGSHGNCYTMTFGGYNLMIDCGISLKEIMKQVYLPEYQYCIVTHAHSDHSKSWEKLLSYGIKLIMSKEAKDNLEIDDPINLIESRKLFELLDIKILPLELTHNVHNLGFYIEWKDEKIFFATDCSNLDSYAFKDLTRTYIEANYDECYEPHFRNYNNHLSIDQALSFIKRHKNENLKEVKLLHISKQFGNEEIFNERLKEIMI